MDFSSFLDSRLRGSGTLGLARQGRSEVLPSANVLPSNAMLRFSRELLETLWKPKHQEQRRRNVF